MTGEAGSAEDLGRCTGEETGVNRMVMVFLRFFLGRSQPNFGGTSLAKLGQAVGRFFLLF